MSSFDTGRPVFTSPMIHGCHKVEVPYCNWGHFSESRLNRGIPGPSLDTGRSSIQTGTITIRGPTWTSPNIFGHKVEGTSYRVCKPDYVPCLLWYRVAIRFTRQDHDDLKHCPAAAAHSLCQAVMFMWRVAIISSYRTKAAAAAATAALWQSIRLPFSFILQKHPFGTTSISPSLTRVFPMHPQASTRRNILSSG